MDNTNTNAEVITEARKVAKLYRGVGHRYGIEKNLDLLADRLEAAEAELTRRAEARGQAWATYQSEHGYTTYPTQPDTGADFAAGFDAGAALAAGSVSLEPANTTLAQVIADALGWDWESAPGVPSPVEAVSDVAAAVEQHLSLEAVKAETTTEWNAVRQDATGELWDVYEPFDSREDAERVAAEWRGNNEPGDDPVVVVERTKGVAPGEWQIVTSEVKRG